MIVDIVDKYCTDDNNPIKNLRLKESFKPITWVLGHDGWRSWPTCQLTGLSPRHGKGGGVTPIYQETARENCYKLYVRKFGSS